MVYISFKLTINSSLENYSKKEEEIEDALKSLNNYYEWLLNLEKANKDNLDSNDYFFKLVCEMKNHINKLFKKLTITQKDWDLLDYYHTEIEKMLNNKEELTTNFSTKNRNTNVTIENIDLDDDNKEDLKKDESKKIFRKSTLEEKADYLTFKTLRKYGVDSYHFDADKINVKNAKKELKQFNNTQKKYEKLINKDHNYEIDEVSYAIYNTVKNAKEDLENTGINHENNNKEIFVNELRNNYDRTVYLKRQKDLKSSALTISNVKEILGNIPDESFNKIKENYRKVKRRLIGLGAGICAGVLAITSFGVGGYKNYQKNLKNNSLVYENNDISIYGNDNQIVNLNNKTVTYEENIAGFGAKVSEKETEAKTKLEETNKVETKLELEPLVSEKETEAETKLEETDKVETKLELETLVSEKETEDETKLEETNKVETKLELEPLVREKETEAETKLEETEPYTEKIEEPIIVNKNNAIIENLKVLPEEENHDIDLETSSLEKLSSIKDEKDLLNTYKNELQNLEALLPQSNIELENVRNIGDVVNVITDANLQNDEYSLIKHSEGHQSIHKDTLPRVICSIIMSDGKSGFTAKTMEEAESLLKQGYYVAGYGVLNPYSKDTSNLEGFFESEDVVGLVRK